MNNKKLFSLLFISLLIFVSSKCYEDITNIVFSGDNETAITETQTNANEEDNVIEDDHNSDVLKSPGDDSFCPDILLDYSDPEFDHKECNYKGRGPHNNQICDIYECQNVYYVYSIWIKLVWVDFEGCVEKGTYRLLDHETTGQVFYEYSNCCDPRPCVPNTCVECSLNTCP